MADLVDKQSVVELVMCYCPDDDGGCSKADTDVRDLLDEIENLPDLVYMEVEWFDIKKKRPDMFGHYLTYNAGNDSYLVLSYSPEYASFGIYDTKVTHWTYLPNKPKKESEDDG